MQTKLAWTGALAPDTGRKNSPKALYMSQCAICHGEKMTGSPPAMPSLVGVGDKFSPAQIATTIRVEKEECLLSPISTTANFTRWLIFS